MCHMSKTEQFLSRVEELQDNDYLSWVNPMQLFATTEQEVLYV